MHRSFLITIDVEDWFQVENFKAWVPFANWDSHELRVETNVHRLLDLFDSIKLPSFPASQLPAAKKVQCTFFALGWLAERRPNLIREIAARGHEVASHGCCHVLPDRMSRGELRRDLADSRKRLEDTIGRPVVGYRAPSFAVNDHTLQAVAECGYLYDSSYNSFSLHGRYGKINLNGQPRVGIAHRLGDNFYEIPLSNLNLENLIGSRFTVHGSRQNFRFVLPWSGGGYFRIMPFWIFRRGVRRILERQDAYVFYLHPWEIDPNQPRVHAASYNHRFRHYTNLQKTYQNLKDLITSFSSCRFVTCKKYLNAVSAGIAQC